jgi:predicted acetyltransferase
VTIEIRIPAEEKWREAMSTASSVFGDELKDEDYERYSKTLTRDRFYAAYDDGLPIGTAADFPFTLTVPGGELPAGGVTWVAVMPTHRRQGVLTKLMRRELDDLHERGEPLAILWASEAAIYGRFGYGVAAPHFEMEADRARFALREDPGPRGRVRPLALAEAVDPCMQVYDRLRTVTPGFTARPREWWEMYRLADPEHWRRGASPKAVVVIEVDGEPAGYAIYRVKHDWEAGFPKGQVQVVEALATPSAERDLWRFLFGIDLTVRVQSRVDPGSPLPLMVVDARSLNMRYYEGLWLRIVEVGGALAGRSYASDDSVVLEVRDEFCKWNAGRWRVGGDDVARTNDDADLELNVADLASAYLGAFSFSRLARAERVRELKEGALVRADALFRTQRPPYCPEDF